MKLLFQCISILIAIFVNSAVNAQVDTIPAHQHFVIADSLLDHREYKKSLHTFEKAAALYKKQEIWHRYVESLNRIAQNQYKLTDFEAVIRISDQVLLICAEKLDNQSIYEAKAYANKAKTYRRTNQYHQALDAYKKAVDITQQRIGANHIRVANMYSSMGICYDELELIDEAQEYYNKSLAIHHQLAKEGQENNPNDVRLNLAILYSRSGLFKKALPMYEKVIEGDIQQYGENHPYVADDYYNLGANYSMMGENYHALQCFQKGLDVLKQNTDSTDESFAYLYNGLASQYTRLGQLDRGLKYYEQALKIYKDIYGEHHFSTGTTLVNLGNVYMQNAEYSKALVYFEKAYAIIKGLYGENNRSTFKINEDFGELYEKQGKYVLAETYFKKHVDFALKSFGPKNQNTAKCLIHHARVQLQQGKTTSAIQQYHQALIAITQQFTDTSVYSLPSVRDFTNETTALQAVYGKAKAFATHAKQNRNEKDMEFSLSNYLLCDSLVNKTRNSYVSVEDKIILEKTTTKIYKDALQLAIQLYQKTGAKLYLEKAFYFSEKNKAQLLEQQLQKSNAQSFAKIPDEKLALIEETKAKLALYKTKQYESTVDTAASDTQAENKYAGIIFSLTRKNDSLMKELEQQYPQYHQLKYASNIISVHDIKKQLPADTGIIEYFVTQDTIYAFVLTKDALVVHELVGFDLEKKVHQFREAIINKDTQQYKKIGHTLYKELVVPLAIEENIENLIIVPDRALWHLNFDILLTEDSPTGSAKEFPYLLRNKVISYANSAHLFFDHTSPQSTTLQECLAFSFSDMSNTTKSDLALRNANVDLPGSRKEIQGISEVIDGTFLYDHQAVEANFKQNAKKYALIHLALHGEIDDQNPENSKLYFSKATDTIEDNFLFTHEIYALEIPADLVVLSACNTGVGKIYNGEGVMSLGRAFQYAGTQSLVLTHWEVSDETTPALMKNFYSNLKKGMSRAKALQQAKLQSLETANVYQSAPFYWAGFYLIGDNKPIQFEANNNTYIIFLLVVLFCGLFVGLYLKKRNKQVN